MKRLSTVLLSLLVLLTWTTVGQAADCKAVYGDSDEQFKLATGSPGELGMLETLAEAFNAEHGTSMCWVKAGSGKSLQLLKDKEVDIAMVHAPAAEKQALADGWAIDRTLIGSNEFYIVGPEDDPADIAQADSAADAYRRIAESESRFLTRADNSGTHKKELSIWEQAGIEPSGDWYIPTHDFMMATLKKADEVGGYFMTDSSTWVAGKNELGATRVLFKGDPYLVNTYHALAQPEGATSMQPVAVQFIDFVASERGQEIIESYGKDKYGEGMYMDAEYAQQYEH